VDALESKIFDTTNPIHVQTKVSVTTAEILDLVEGLDEDAVFTDTGTLRTEVLEGEVFTTVAEQTPYAEDPEATAEVLARAKELVIEEGASGESVADYLQRRRQEVFADGVGAVDPEFDDVADQADAGGSTRKRSRLSRRVRMSTPLRPPSGRPLRTRTATPTTRVRT